MATATHNSASGIKVMTDAQDKHVPNRNNYLLPLALIISLFFLWGMANNLNDILIKQFKKAFELSDFQSGLVQSAFYFGYFVLAIPASLVMNRFSYKTGVVVGLLLYATGAFLFFPAAQMQSYSFFLGALFVIASGLAFLETAANPYVTALGSPETATFRLNLAQSFNPIGCITGILVGQHFIFSGVEYTPEQIAQLTPEALQNYYAQEAQSVQTPYLVIGAVVLFFAIMVIITRFPALVSEQTESSHQAGGLRKLLSLRHFKLAVLAQFFYVGAQVCIWSFMIRYAQSAVVGTTEIQAANYLTISLVVFTLGRFVGTAILNKISGAKLLGVYAVINIGLLAVAIFSASSVGLWALVASSFFMSIMYPTIFSLGIDGLEADTKLGSSVLVMAIIGGAVLTAIMGKVSDMYGIALAMLVPLLCFVFVSYYGFGGYRKTNTHHS